MIALFGWFHSWIRRDRRCSLSLGLGISALDTVRTNAQQKKMKLNFVKSICPFQIRAELSQSEQEKKSIEQDETFSFSHSFLSSISTPPPPPSLSLPLFLDGKRYYDNKMTNERHDCGTFINCKQLQSSSNFVLFLFVFLTRSEQRRQPTNETNRSLC